VIILDDVVRECALFHMICYCFISIRVAVCGTKLPYGDVDRYSDFNILPALMHILTLNLSVCNCHFLSQDSASY